MANLKYILTKPGILKACSVVLGLIVVCIGAPAVLQAELYTTWKDWKKVCSYSNVECPSKWTTYENFFVGVTIVFWILSLVNLISGFFIDFSKNVTFKYIDIACHFLAGVFVLIAGILILVSARSLDSFFDEHFSPLDSHFTWGDVKFPGSVSCKAYSYGNKLFAGFLAIMHAVCFHFTTCFVIYAT